MEATRPSSLSPSPSPLASNGRKVMVVPPAATNAKSTNPKIEHVVCLMLENRSFDHMCGYLKARNSNIDGVTGKETNPLNPAKPSEGSAQVSATSGYVTTVDPDHSVPGTTAQIFGASDAPHADPAPMNGFVANYNKDGDTQDKGAAIMECFNPNNVPTISSLATQFALFDRWYAAVPGPTQPNRLFMHTATSYGSTVNDIEQLALGYPQATIYEKLSEAGATWKDYWSDFPSILACADVREPQYWECIRDIEAFYDDCAAGTLPNYCFVEPRWFELFEVPASDQHPPHPVTSGEYLMADVYEALRNGPKWNSTLLVITYDEHGGFWDHVSPPQKNVPAPDSHRPPVHQDPFNFDRLGIRVPAILVSPWINANTVIHEPASPQTGHYTHTSLLATLKKLFNTDSFLTARDAWSPTIDFVVEARSTPRTDCPTKLPRPGSAEEQAKWARFGRRRVSPELIHAFVSKGATGSQTPLTDLQREMIAISRGLSIPGTLAAAISRAQENALVTEHDGALYVMRQMAEFLERGSHSNKNAQQQDAVVGLVRHMFEFLQTHDAMASVAASRKSY